jgi:16S rRNA (guanine(966)-N(2))-methyltransferase RsmD
MRVTGGEYSGRRIAVPPGEIRPAMDRMRESVFSILTSALGSLEGLAVLDLFSGSGSMALEALSRGARLAVLVERDRGKATVIRKNFSYVEEDRWTLVLSPAERYLKRVAVRSEGHAATAGSSANPGAGTYGPPFDLLFVDPPFRYRGKAGLLSQIASAGVLAPEGRVMIHVPAEDDLAEEPEGLVRTDRRAYGRSIVHIFETAGGGAPQ